MQGNLESIQELRKLFFDKLKLECNNATSKTFLNGWSTH